ncbi:MAG: c-type cytochrome [Myxococcales bacterium]|nr:c-type cytochrome [Myxococcales bacterium]
MSILPGALLLATILTLVGCDGGNGTSTAPTATAGPSTTAAKRPESLAHGPGPYAGRATAGPRAKSKPQRMQELMGWIRGAYVDGAPTGAMPEIDDTMVALGDRLYADLCVPCHGEAGDGRGPDALHPPAPAADSHAPALGADDGAPLDPAPRDFTRAVFKLRSTPSGSLPTDADLFRSISAGLHGSAMLPFVALEERERWALVAKVKRFSKRFTEADPATPVGVPEPPPVTSELVKRGQGLFTDLGCVECHGENGRGDGKRAPELKDDRGKPISPRDLTQGRFRRGSESKDIFLTLRTGFDGTPMASFEAYPLDQLWAVAAFVHSLVEDPVHRQDSPPVHPQERLGLRIGMRPLLGAAGP